MAAWLVCLSGGEPLLTLESAQFAECRYRALIERERALATGTVYQVDSGAIRSNV